MKSLHLRALFSLFSLCPLCVALAACGSSSSAPLPTPPSASSCSAGAALAELPSTALVNAANGVTWDETGLVFSTLDTSGGPDAIVSIPVSLSGGTLTAGKVTTLLSSASPNLVSTVVATPSTVYYAISIGSAGVYSVPRTGGTPAAIFTPKNGQSLDTFTMDANNLYLTEANDFGTAEAFDILSVPTAGGPATTIYTAPNGQTVDNLVLSGSVLYWTEGAPILAPATPTTIRWAPVTGTSLTATEYASVPIGTSVSNLVIPSGGSDGEGAAPAVYFSASSALGATSASSGLYRVTPTAAPVAVDPTGSLPLLGFGSLLIYNGPPGVDEYDTATSVKSTVLSNTFGVDSLAVTSVLGAPALVYSKNECVYQMTGWTPPSP